MAISYTRIPVLFTGGIQSKTDSKVLEAPGLPDCINGQYEQLGEISMRPGFTKLGDSTIAGTSIDLGGASNLATLSDELILLGKNHLYSYSEGGSGWFDRGSLVSVIPEVKNVSKAVSNQELADRAEAGGIVVTAWEDSRGGIYYSIQDSETSAFYSQNVLLTSTGSRPRITSIGGIIQLFWLDTTVGYIYCLPVSPTDIPLSISSPPIVVSDTVGTTNPCYDVVGLNRTDYTLGVIAFKTNTNQTRYHLVDSTGARATNPWGSTVFSDVAVNSTMLSLAARPDHASIIFWLACYDGTTVYNYPVSTSLIPFVPGTYTPGLTITNLTNQYQYNVSYGGYKPYLYLEESAAQTYNYLIHSVTLDGDLIGTGRTTFKRHAGLASKPFLVAGNRSTEDDQLFLAVVHESIAQSTLFLYRQDGLLVSKILSGIHGGLPGKAHLPQVQGIGANVFVLATNSKARLEVGLGQSPVFTDTGIVQVSFDFESGQGYRSVQAGKSLYLTGGQLWVYDTNFVAESGFHLFPENISVAENGAGNLSSGGAGTYSYMVVYEYPNAAGERIQSDGILINFTTTGASKKLRLTIPTLTHTGKDRVAIAVYRTVKNPPTGAPLYRVSSLDPSAVGDNKYLVNDTTVDTVTFDDNISDAALISNELCYLNAQVGNSGPPSAYAVCRTSDRVWLISAENRREIWFSKLIETGNQVGWNEDQIIELNEDATGIEQLNNTVIIFTDTQIYGVSGNGPSNLSNDFNTFSQPQQISTDAGCIDQRTLVRTKDGLMFQSRKGFYLLDQGFGVQYIGADVEYWNDQTFTSATLLPDRNEVVFLAESGRTLVYNTFFRKWLTWSVIGAGAVNYQDALTYCVSSGNVYQMGATYSDAGEPYNLTVITPWIKLAQLAAYQRVRSCFVLGEYHSAHILQIYVGYDFDEATWHGPYEWDPSTALDLHTLGDYSPTLGDGPATLDGAGNRVYNCQINLARRECQAVRLKIQGSGAAGQQFSLNAIALEVGLADQAGKLPYGRKIS